jgi:hypothetical protein
MKGTEFTHQLLNQNIVKHEIKRCPRCNVSFECKVGSILLCQCTTVTLSPKERDYLKEDYEDCLCASCIKDLKAEFHKNKLMIAINKLMRRSKRSL